MRVTKIYTNDKLVENDDNSYTYTDSYGVSVEIQDIESFYSWTSAEGIIIDDKLAGWLNGDTINIDIDFDNATALIESNYPGQFPRQMPAYLKIFWNEGGRPRVTAFTAERSIEGHPFDEFHNTATAFRLPNNVDATQLVDWIIDDLADGITEINDSYKEVWDGSNYVGRFFDEYSFVTIENMVGGAPTLGEQGGLLDVGDWLDASTSRPDEDDPTGKIEGFGDITANTTDDEISAMAKKIKSDADSENVVFDGDVEDYIREIRDDCRYWEED